MDSRRRPEIRQAVAVDNEALGRLDRETWSPLHAVLPRPRPPYRPFFEEERYGPPYHLVALVDGEIVGFLRLVPPTPLAANAHVRTIMGLAVAERARGQGVARALLRASFVEARAQGAIRVTLRVLGHNAPARALYESEGFVVEGVLPGEMYLEGKYVDDVLMGRQV
ncbi:GNAT family N-acetyltransferase [Streptomyces tsukubensis]|uniref:GNAT family N-acetyltransferase n=2 Tax=Streptomyces tsukubensis TaxID=83656 RepID=A0A1V4A820_9ACTN|nr:GNAT family N-acetyltransferase [Streptomyces tsukubensis]QFR97616.1 GNAT family N-acetyltransferase [Streptomyces tsukubensis]